MRPLADVTTRGVSTPAEMQVLIKAIETEGDAARLSHRKRVEIYSE